MPKTYRERLDELKVGQSILIKEDKRIVWSNNITAMRRDSRKQFTVRTNPDTKEMRVWRLADLTEAK